MRGARCGTWNIRESTNWRSPPKVILCPIRSNSDGLRMLRVVSRFLHQRFRCCCGLLSVRRNYKGLRFVLTAWINPTLHNSNGKRWRVVWASFCGQQSRNMLSQVYLLCILDLVCSRVSSYLDAGDRCTHFDCVCMYVCVWVCVCVYMHANISMCFHVHFHAHTTYTYVRCIHTHKMHCLVWFWEYASVLFLSGASRSAGQWIDKIPTAVHSAKKRGVAMGLAMPSRRTSMRSSVDMRQRCFASSKAENPDSSAAAGPVLAPSRPIVPSSDSKVDQENCQERPDAAMQPPSAPVDTSPPQHQTSSRPTEARNPSVHIQI